MELHLKIIGWLLIVLASAHIFFPRYFDWDKDLTPLSLINKQMMYVHTFFIALIILLIGLLCLTSTSDLISTKLGNKISLGLGIFWTARLATQFFGYSRDLWRGKLFETVIHVLFSILWIYMGATFIIIYFNGRYM